MNPLAILGTIVINFVKYVIIAALMYVGISYITNAEFRNAVNQLFLTILNKIVTDVKILVNAINEIIKNRKKWMKYSGYEIHHIVARRATGAWYSRLILESVNLTVQSPFNLVPIKKTLHKHLHTNGYHSAVSAVLLTCYTLGKTRTEKRQRVIGGLILIAYVLIVASQVV